VERIRTLIFGPVAMGPIWTKRSWRGGSENQVSSSAGHARVETHLELPLRNLVVNVSDHKLCALALPLRPGSVAISIRRWAVLAVHVVLPRSFRRSLSEKGQRGQHLLCRPPDVLHLLLERRVEAAVRGGFVPRIPNSHRGIAASPYRPAPPPSPLRARPYPTVFVGLPARTGRAAHGVGTRAASGSGTRSPVALLFLLFADASEGARE
jgi:hypothetical protein